MNAMIDMDLVKRADAIGIPRGQFTEFPEGRSNLLAMSIHARFSIDMIESLEALAADHDRLEALHREALRKRIAREKAIERQRQYRSRSRKRGGPRSGRHPIPHVLEMEPE